VRNIDSTHPEFFACLYDDSIVYILNMGIGKRDSVREIVKLTHENIGPRFSSLVKN
jgi:hypothetical protein